jgi:regulator of replication initiation timing
MTRQEKEILMQIQNLTLKAVQLKEENESLTRENGFLKELLLKNGASANEIVRRNHETQNKKENYTCRIRFVR